MPIGIGIIGMPPPMPDAPAACAISAAEAPTPESAPLAIPFGIEPCQVGGVDIAPTKCALPKSAPTPPSPPTPPPSPFAAGATSPTNFGISAAPIAAAPKPAVPAFALCANDIIGDINMLAGYIAICATDMICCSGTPPTSDDTAVATTRATAATADACRAPALPTPPPRPRAHTALSTPAPAPRPCPPATAACPAAALSHPTYGVAAAAIATDAGPAHGPPANPAITESNDDADPARSAASEFQASAAKKSGPDPAPAKLRPQWSPAGKNQNSGTLDIATPP